MDEVREAERKVVVVADASRHRNRIAVVSLSVLLKEDVERLGGDGRTISRYVSINFQWNCDQVRSPVRPSPSQFPPHMLLQE